MELATRFRWTPAWAGAILLLAAGCTSPSQYIHNGFKVGPNYCPPRAVVSQRWIDADDARVRELHADISHWWWVFNDPALNNLVNCAYNQNLTLREAGYRVLEARAQFDIAVGNLFPQTQNMTGSYSRQAVSTAGGTISAFTTPGSTLPTTARFFDTWSYGFNLNWELDFWGQFRRAIIAAGDNVDVAVAGYDQVLVTFLGDVASNYVQLRQAEREIALSEQNAELQREVLRIVERRFEAGRTSELDVDQARSQLYQIESAIPAFEISARQATNALCVLMGIPPCDLRRQLGPAPIPVAPTEVVVGIPCDMVRRRPDVRQAERTAAAQSEQIGIAEANLYPAFFINGTFGYTARDIPNLFTPAAFNASVGPSFQWNILNYGRIINNERYQDYRFQELVVTYQQTVLQGLAEVENGIITFLKSQQRAKLLSQSVVDARKAVDIVIRQYNVGTVDFNRVATLEQTLVQTEDLEAQAEGQIGQGLIQVYRALGGGWEMRLPGADGMPIVGTKPAEDVPAPPPEGKAQPNAAPDDKNVKEPALPKVAEEIPASPPVAPAPPASPKPTTH